MDISDAYFPDKNSQIQRYVETSAQWYMANYFPEERDTFMEVWQKYKYNVSANIQIHLLLHIKQKVQVQYKHDQPYAGRGNHWESAVGTLAQFCQ